MRILIVTDQYAPMVGGVPAVTRALGTGLARRGHQVAVLAPSPDHRSRRGHDDGAQVHYLGSAPWPWYEGMRIARVPARAMGSLITSFRPAVVHIHSPLVLGMAARHRAQQLAVPVIYTNHYLPVNVNPYRRPSATFDSLFYAYVVRFSNRCGHVTAPTATALRLLRGRGLRVPSRVLTNGVDAGVFAPGPASAALRGRYGLPRTRPLILSVGRLSPEKRVDVLLSALALLKHPAHTLIAGTGPEEPRLRAMAARLGLAGRVTFAGHVPAADLPDLYRLGDVFAIPSEAELQSLVTMEAMATGLPVVAANSHALGELVADGCNGFLVPRGCGPELAARLDRLLADAALRKRMADASLERIASHDRHHALAAWENLYGQMASGAATGRCA